MSRLQAQEIKPAVFFRWPVQPEEAILEAVAAETAGYAGADLKALASAAVVQAARRGLDCSLSTERGAAVTQLQVSGLFLCYFEGPACMQAYNSWTGNVYTKQWTRQHAGSLTAVPVCCA